MDNLKFYDRVCELVYFSCTILTRFGETSALIHCSLRYHGVSMTVSKENVCLSNLSKFYLVENCINNNIAV